MDGQQTHEKMLNITNHQESRIKVIMRYLLIFVRMAITKKMKIKKIKIKSFGEDVEERESCTLLVGLQISAAYGPSSKRLKIELLNNPAILLLGIYWKKIKTQN